MVPIVVRYLPKPFDYTQVYSQSLNLIQPNEVLVLFSHSSCPSIWMLALNIAFVVRSKNQRPNSTARAYSLSNSNFSGEDMQLFVLRFRTRDGVKHTLN